MKIEEFLRTLDDMSEEECEELVLDIRKNRAKFTINETKVKKVKKEASKKSMKNVLKSLTKEERQQLLDLFPVKE